MASFFRLREHVEYPGGRWHLSVLAPPSGHRLDSRIFTKGKSVQWVEPLTLQVRKPGPSLDFTCDAFGMPIVTRTLGEAMIHLLGDTIQLFPVQIDGAKGLYDILNITQTVDCLDETRTRGFRWTPDAGGGPRKYSTLADIHVDPERANGHKLFRLQDWKVAVICSQEVKDLFEAFQVKGALFDLAI